MQKWCQICQAGQGTWLFQFSLGIIASGKSENFPCIENWSRRCVRTLVTECTYVYTNLCWNCVAFKWTWRISSEEHSQICGYSSTLGRCVCRCVYSNIFCIVVVRYALPFILFLERIMGFGMWKNSSGWEIKKLQQPQFGGDLDMETPVDYPIKKMEEWLLLLVFWKCF